MTAKKTIAKKNLAAKPAVTFKPTIATAPANPAVAKKPLVKTRPLATPVSMRALSDAIMAQGVVKRAKSAFIEV